MKTLTDVTPYTDFVKKTQALFDGDSIDSAVRDEDEEERTYDPYTADDFLHDVFMDEDRYIILKALLLTKKNVILQGAWCVFNQLPLLFVIGLPIGLAKKQAARCCMEALVLYLTFHYFLSTILSQWGNVFGVDFAA